MANSTIRENENQINQSNKLGFSRKQRKIIEANYLSGKDFRNFSFEQWTKEEKHINDQIKKIRKELENCSDKEKEVDLQNEIIMHRCQMKACLKYGEKALDKEILEEEKIKSEQNLNDNQREQNDLQVDEEIKNRIEAIINENGRITSIHEKPDQKVKIGTKAHGKINGLTEKQMERLLNIDIPTINDQTDIENEKQTKKIFIDSPISSSDSFEGDAEKKARRIVELKAKIDAEVEAKIQAEEKAREEAKEKAKKEAEAEAKLEAEENARMKKGLWTRIKEKVSKNFKKIVGPVLAALTLGGSTQLMVNAPQMNSNDINSKNYTDTIQSDNANSKKTDKPIKAYPEKLEVIEKDSFMDSLKVDVKINQNITLGDVVVIDEGCNYYENSLEGGNHNVVNTKNQWRPSGKYLIDGLAVTYQDNDGNWKIAKSSDDESNGGNYGNLGLNSNDYVQKIMQENGLTQDQIRVMYHINRGTVSGEYPTGWIQTPEDGFKVDSKYKNQQQSEIEK